MSFFSSHEKPPHTAVSTRRTRRVSDAQSPSAKQVENILLSGIILIGGCYLFRAINRATGDALLAFLGLLILFLVVGSLFRADHGSHL